MLHRGQALPVTPWAPSVGPAPAKASFRLRPVPTPGLSPQRRWWQQEKLVKETSGSSQNPTDEARGWLLIVMSMGFGPQGCPKLPGTRGSGVRGQTTGQRGMEATAVLRFPGRGQQGGVDTTLAGFSDFSGLWGVLRCRAPGQGDSGRGVSLPGAGQVAEAGPPRGVGTGHGRLPGPWQEGGGICPPGGISAVRTSQETENFKGIQPTHSRRSAGLHPRR